MSALVPEAITSPDPDEILSHVAALPLELRRALALGPLPELEPGDHGYTDGSVPDCRVCAVLDTAALVGRAELHARELLAFHDFTALSLDLARATRSLDRGHSRFVIELLGALSYARCCQIYAAARSTLR